MPTNVYRFNTVIAQFQDRIPVALVDRAVDIARRASVDYPNEFLSELISALATVTDNPTLAIEFVSALQRKQKEFSNAI